MADTPQILLVDTDTAVLETLQARLRTAGYRVETARDGSGALDKIEFDTPTLVIMEILLPDLNGYQVCRALRKKHNSKSLPVVFLSAKNEPADRYWAEQVGADGFIDKPFEVRELLADVDALLKRDR